MKTNVKLEAYMYIHKNNRLQNLHLETMFFMPNTIAFPFLFLKKDF